MPAQLERQPEETVDVVDVETISARARAMASPVRWRVLRACLDGALTNKELADLLGVNPGSMLHHVRTLVSTGFLEPQEPRRGSRNAVEIPYRTTSLVWQAGRSAAGFGEFMLETIPREVGPGGADVFRTVVYTDDERRTELQCRMRALLAEYEVEGEGDVRAWSVVVSVQPVTG